MTETSQILQQIATNTASTKTLISLTTKSLEFSVEFPAPIPASTMALTQLRCYYSWPNIRAEPFRGKPPNNSFVLSYKKLPNGNPETHTILLPTGAYDIEDINDEIIERIEAITGPNLIEVRDGPDRSPIEIHAHEPLLSTSLRINSPNYSVDIYNSSIRTVLGWPENPPGVVAVADLSPEPAREDYPDFKSAKLAHDTWFNNLVVIHPRLPEPKKSDFLVDDLVVASDNFEYQYGGFFNTLKTASDLKIRVRVITNDQNSEYIEDGPRTWWLESSSGNYTITYNTLPNVFGTINTVFYTQLQLLRESFQRCLDIKLMTTRGEIKSHVRKLNQIIADGNYINKALLDSIAGSSKQDFLTLFSLTDKTFPDYKFSALRALNLKTRLNNLVNEFFPQIHALWYKSIPAEEFSDNSLFKSGKHRSPLPANITSTIAIHVIADIILDSYSVDESTNTRATPGYILYKFSPNVSPGSLIMMNPPNLVYLAVASDFIARINFRITDQNFSLIDLRDEQLQITLEVKS